MKKLLVLISTLLIAAGFAFADPVEGYWISIDEKTNEATAAWNIYQQDGLLYGKIVALAGQDQSNKATGGAGKKYAEFANGADLKDVTMVGSRWIYGLSKETEGKWSKGSIIDPGSGSKYKCKITYHAKDGKKYTVDTLEMRGEIGAGIGRSQFWKKSTKEAAESLR